jgi:signal transduction histidine kinase
LLDLAKLDAQRFSLDLRPVDLLEVVTDTVDGFEPAAEKLGLELSIHDPVGLDAGPPGATARWPSVAADPDRLAQLIANLVENAMKFASRRIEVSTWFRPANGSTPGTAQITVDDDGPGIPPADLSRVFDRLWTRGKGREVGSGLGLAIVNELVAAMGGTVSATSPVPRVGAPASDDTAGTRVVVTLRCWATAT